MRLPTARRAAARVRILLLWVLLALSGPLAAAPAATPLPAAGPVPQISLLTFGPGRIYWERFGHNALVVREAGFPPRVYNYGIFDFRQKNFFLNFARGRMVYRVEAFPWRWTLQAYAAEGRWVVEQDLALDAAQARQLADFLAWNVLPENAEYRYDYFVSNCSTRVRDAIDRALGGALRQQLEPRPAATRYRREVLDLMAPEPSLMLGMDLIMGPAGDQGLNQWQDGFIPMRLMDALRGVRVAGSDGVLHPLVGAERRLLEGGSGSSGRAWSMRAWRWLLFAAGLAGAVLIVWLRRPPLHRGLRRTLANGLVYLYLLVCGLAGTVLLAAWLFTEHWAMAANHNLLLLNPLWWLLLPAVRQRGRAPGPAQTLARLAVMLMALLSVPVLLFGGQDMLTWVALLLPLHLAVLTTLRR